MFKILYNNKTQSCKNANEVMEYLFTIDKINIEPTFIKVFRRRDFSGVTFYDDGTLICKVEPA